QVLRSVPLPVLFRFARQGAYRMRAYNRYVMNLHRKMALGPHWYLHIIGVDPAYQGQGLASRLVRPVMERIDREQMPCFVETHSGKNVDIYRRFGFEVAMEDKIPGTELTSFAMFRKIQTTL
ncbi:MAG: GNAT family N-acetyltransferase, partial [Dehalococcoidales bacterium]